MSYCSQWPCPLSYQKQVSVPNVRGCYFKPFFHVLSGSVARVRVNLLSLAWDSDLAQTRSVQIDQMKTVAGRYCIPLLHVFVGRGLSRLQADNRPADRPEHRCQVSEYHVAAMAACSVREAELLRELQKVKQSSAKEIRELKDKLDEALQVRRQSTAFG